MKNMKQLAASIAVIAALGAMPLQQAHAQKEQVVQDGIVVKPLSRVRVIVPEAQMNEQSAQQYQAMMSEAQQKGVLVPATDPQVKRLRGVAQRIIPHTPRWNASAKNWKWQVNLIDASASSPASSTS